MHHEAEEIVKHDEMMSTAYWHTVVSNVIQKYPKSFVVSSFKTVHFTKVVQVKIRHYNPNYSTALIRFATIATMEAKTEGEVTVNWLSFDNSSDTYDDYN